MGQQRRSRTPSHCPEASKAVFRGKIACVLGSCERDGTEVDIKHHLHDMKTVAATADPAISIARAEKSSPSLVVDRRVARRDYLMTEVGGAREGRPRHRGALCAWLWHSKSWICFSMGHVIAVAFATGFAPAFLISRAAFALATIWQTWASDLLHNFDLQKDTKMTLPQEFLYWRLDLLSIALILASQYALWSITVGMHVRFELLVIAATAWGPLCVGAALRAMTVSTYSGPLNVACKIAFGIQFLFCGWLAIYVNCYTRCGYNSAIWFAYLPGFVCYLSKIFINEHSGWHFERFGPHEWFHVFVYMGHVTTMVLDAGAQSGWLKPCFEDVHFAL